MKVFQEKPGELLELKELDRFDYEKLLQKLIEKNLNVIFPSLEFLKSGYQINNLIPDTIAFDTDRNSFVVIEYKNVKHHGVIEQGVDYYDLFEKRPEAFVLLYQKVKRKVIESSDVNWDDNRVIFISPQFTTRQKTASRYLKVPIELYEISRYENGLVMLTKVETEPDIPVPKTKSSPKVKLQGYSEEEYLEGKYGNTVPSKEMKDLYSNLRNRILDTFPEIERQQKKKYIGFYSKKDGSTICTIVVLKSKLELRYAIAQDGILKANKFVMDLEKPKKIGRWGTGRFMSHINTEADIAKALPLIEKVYNLKVK